MGLVMAMTASSASAATVKATPADNFVEFVGIQVHVDRAGPVWGATTWIDRVGELGIRYARSSFKSSSGTTTKTASIFQRFGVRFNAVVSTTLENDRLDPSKIKAAVAFLRTVGAEKFVSIEGPNESSSTKYEGNAQWATHIRDYQRQLYTAVKGDAALKSLPVLAPTVWRRIEADYATLGSLATSADNGTLHLYNGGRKPSIYKRERTYQDNGPEAPLSRALDNVQITVPGKPAYVTETGFNVRTGKNVQARVPEKTAAKYVLRLVNEFFLLRDRVKRTFVYSLVDSEDPERQYGLVREDMTRRPAFYAVKNMIKIFSDKGANFNTGSLTYTLTGSLTDIKSYVLQKRNGSFYLVIWNDFESWNRTRLVEATPPLRQLTLNVSTHRFKTARFYEPTALGQAKPDNGALPVKTVASPRSIALGVSDQVLIVELVP